MRRRPALARLLTLGAILAVAPSAHAQGGRKLQVVGMQGITFGQLLGGTARIVPPTDAVRAGRFDIIGPNGDEILLVQFTLPGALVGPGGGTVPLAFDADDAGYSAAQSVGSQVTFDPRAARTIRLSKTGRGSIFLGATATPSVSTPSGSYAATITLTTAYVQ